MNAHSLARNLPVGRALLVDRVRKQRWTAAKAAAAAGISVRTAYKWLRRHATEGLQGLRDRSSRPLRSPSSLPADREALVLELRRSKLTAKQIARQLGLTRPTVARALARNGVSRLRFLEPPKPANRYQWPNPGDLIHVDIKKLGRFRSVGHRITGRHAGVHKTSKGAGWEFAHVCVDDASRLAYVELLPNERRESAVGFLHRAIACITFGRSPTHLARTAKPSASSKRSYASGPTLLPIPRRHVGLENSPGGSATTTRSGPTVVSTTCRPSPESGQGR